MNDPSKPPANSNRAGATVVVLGGGLAALSLAIQLRQNHPGLGITLIEKQPLPFPEAAYKVGESSVEVGAHYYTSVLGLGHCLTRSKLPKLGLRYFFNPGDNPPLDRRVEIGQSYFPVVHSYNFDRGRMENLLVDACRRRGIDYLDDAKVTAVDLGDADHTVTYRRGDGEHTLRARWVVDASGRASLLKKKLGLAEKNDHDVNAVWFRVDESLAVDDLSTDRTWRRRVPFGMRRLSTNHLMGPGYWVWFIPLSSGATSIGIVADAQLHPLTEMNTFDRAMDWLHAHEPEAARAIEPHRDRLQDFRGLRHFSYGCQRTFSAERWALTGEAGYFIDPFYSPGSDFIAISNGFVAALVGRDLAGEPIGRLADLYDQVYRGLYQSFLLIYQDQYPMMGNAQVMVAKTIWDFAIYWGFAGILYFHQKLYDPEFMERVLPDLAAMRLMSGRVQRLFRQWHERDPGAWCRDDYVQILDVHFLYAWQTDLDAGLDDEALVARLRDNRWLCEKLVNWIYRRATGTTSQLSASDQAVDPYDDFDLAHPSADPETPHPPRLTGVVEELNTYIELVRAARAADPLPRAPETVSTAAVAAEA